MQVHPQEVDPRGIAVNICRRGERLLVACMIASLLPLVGCSVGLFFEGVRRDNETPDLIVPPESMASVDSGATMEVFLRSGSLVTGVFLGTGREMPDAYGERYGRWRASIANPASVPVLGEELTILKATEAQQGVVGTFLGLDPKSILVLRSGDRDTMNLWSPTLSYVFDGKGEKLELGPLRTEMTKGTAPMISALRLDASGVEKRIPLEDVDRVRIPALRMKKWIGLGIGLAVDVAAVLLFVQVFPPF